MFDGKRGLNAGWLEGHWLPEPARDEFLRKLDDYLKKGGEESLHGKAVLVMEPDPPSYAAAVAAALDRGIPVFLGNPRWGFNEWKQLESLPVTLRVWGGGRNGETLSPGNSSPDPWRGHVMISTGGTGGRLRFAMHTLDTLSAAANGLRSYLGGRSLNSLCCLPLFHVSGWMQIVRAWASGGCVYFADLPSLAGAGWPRAEELGVEQISLVPTQVYRLMGEPEGVSWMESFRYVWVGGGPLGESLREELGRTAIPAYPCYGMTETAAMVAVCEPEIWRKDPGLAACALPHAKCTVKDGEVVVRSSSLFRGYFPDMPVKREFYATGDEGMEAGDGRFRILGRRDRFIITGGEKVDPLEVEKGIRGTGMVEDVLVHGAPDPEWGQVVVAWLQLSPGKQLGDVQTRMSQLVAPPLRPKRWHVVDQMPRLENGKPDWGRIRKGESPSPMRK